MKPCNQEVPMRLPGSAKVLEARRDHETHEARAGLRARHRSWRIPCLGQLSRGTAWERSEAHLVTNRYEALRNTVRVVAWWRPSIRSRPLSMPAKNTVPG